MFNFYDFYLKLTTTFPDVPATVLYDVLHDPAYRTTWDKFMLETREIGHLNPNNNINYYAREISNFPFISAI